MHVMVDAKTKKIYAVSITDDKTGDAPEFEKLLSESLKNIKSSHNVKTSEQLFVGADGAYDSNDNFKTCEKQNVIPVIPVRKNFSIKTDGSTARKEQGLIQLGNCKMNDKNAEMFSQLTEEQKIENQKQWKINSGYGGTGDDSIMLKCTGIAYGEDGNDSTYIIKPSVGHLLDGGDGSDLCVTNARQPINTANCEIVVP